MRLKAVMPCIQTFNSQQHIRLPQRVLHSIYAQFDLPGHDLENTNAELPLLHT